MLVMLITKEQTLGQKVYAFVSVKCHRELLTQYDILMLNCDIWHFLAFEFQIFKQKPFYLSHKKFRLRLISCWTLFWIVRFIFVLNFFTEVVSLVDFTQRRNQLYSKFRSYQIRSVISSSCLVTKINALVLVCRYFVQF